MGAIMNIEPIHLAAQYLAAAAISFMPERADDSHTNMGFSAKNRRFETWELNNNGDFLALDLATFSLSWLSADGQTSFALDGRTHNEVVDWINKTASVNGITKPYTYDFHYTLPYGIQGDYQFIKDELALEKEVNVRTLVHEVLSEVLKSNELSSDIRTWPHHFDTGVFAGLPGRENISLGLGMAIPDSLINDYYFYISGYDGHKAVDSSDFEPLDQGEWIQGGFEGAVLALNELSKKSALEFFDTTIRAYSK